MPLTTERLLTAELPQLITVPADRVPEAYAEWSAQVAEAACPKSERVSRLDWGVIQEMVQANGEADGDPERNRRVTIYASTTSILEGGDTIRMHEPRGVFLTVDETGRVIAGDNKPSLRVPAKYGAADPYVLDKLAGAILVEKLMRQGADWGEGYAAWSRLRGVESPTIGMATLHEVPYDAAPIGTDRHALAYSAASHRIATVEFAGLMRERYGAHLTQPEHSADFLAGILDTASATVANRAAMARAYPWVIGGAALLNVVALPKPTDPDNAGVNWN